MSRVRRPSREDRGSRLVISAVTYVESSQSDINHSYQSQRGPALTHKISQHGENVDAAVTLMTVQPSPFQLSQESKVEEQRSVLGCRCGGS